MKMKDYYDTQSRSLKESLASSNSDRGYDIELDYDDDVSDLTELYKSYSDDYQI